VQQSAPGDGGPGRKWYVIAGLLFVIGAIVGATLLYSGISGLRDGLIRAPVPGMTVVDLDETGRWTIFFEHQGEIDGAFYSLPPEVPDGFDVSVVGPNGTEVSAQPGFATFDYTAGGRAGRAIGYLDVTEPGRHTIEASYPGATRFNLALGKDIGGKTLRIVFGAVTIGGFAFISLVIWVITLILRSRAKNRAGQMGSPA